MRRWLAYAGVCLLVAGCSSEVSQQNQNPGGSDGGVYQSDPNDPLVCIGDPDTQIICGKASDFWDCSTMPGGEVKCGYNEPLVPEGGGSWTCEQQEDKIVCTSSDAGDVPGGGGWSCVTTEEGTTCERAAPVPPGGGSYSCVYDESEFGWTCTGSPETPLPGSDAGVPVTPPDTSSEICYDTDESSSLATPPEGYWAKITAQKVLLNGEPAAYIKLWLSKAFVDNTYGEWSIGYSGGPGPIGGGHSFGDLLESDKMEIFIDDTKGNLLFHMALDYLSADASAPSGYASLGVTGGDGSMLKGDASDVIAVQTSLAVNFNALGYVLTEDSPETDMSYTVNPQYPDWIFDVWYESWVKWSAFGATGPGRVYITGLHASPNKISERNLSIVPVPCP